MKRILTLLLALTVCTAYGQEIRQNPALRSFSKPEHRLSGPEHELRLSAGAFPVLIDELDAWHYPFDTGSGFDATKYYQGATYTTGAFTACYSYRCKNWNFGLAVSFMHEYYRLYSNLDGSELNRYGANFISVIPVVRYTWFQFRTLRLYSAAGLGVTFLTGNKNSYTPDSAVGIQLTYIGISAGKRIFGFAELGTGAHGTLAAGVGYRFNAKTRTR